MKRTMPRQGLGQGHGQGQSSHGAPANHGHGHVRQRARDPVKKQPRGTQKTKTAPPPVVVIEDVDQRVTNVKATNERMDANEVTVENGLDVSQEEADVRDDVIGEEQRRREEEERASREEEERRAREEAIRARNEALARAKTASHDAGQFNANMADFICALEDPRFQQVDQDFPVEDLTQVVKSITKAITDFRLNSMDSQNQFMALRENMKSIRESLHFSVTRQALDLRADEESQTEAERELQVKLTHLNAELAQANVDVTQAIRLAADSESSAVKATVAAEKAREEAKRVEEEIEIKTKAEKKRREEERRRMAEQKRQAEAQERKIQEEKQKKEEEWKMRETVTSERSANVYDKWTPVEYEWTNENEEKEITCIARGQPGSFESRNVTCAVQKDKEEEVGYAPNEELISNVIELKATDGEESLKSPIFVAIPHVMSRTSGLSREPVVKAMMEGEWRDLPTKDVTFDTHKDTKFAQAEIRHLTTLVVMSRLKRDYVTLAPHKSQKVTSSYDQRITMTIERKTFDEKEHFLLQVQPIDNATVQEFRSRQREGKNLLASSPVLHTSWESRAFSNPITVTLPCPPNPAKAKKMALARKLKDEKMKQPVKAPMTIDEIEKERERERKRLQQFNEAEAEKKTVTKWYMGEYTNNDDDETDKLTLLAFNSGRWFVEKNVEIRQIKVDVTEFVISQPREKLLVLRTRPSAEEDNIQALATSLTEFLTKRFVEAVVRQRTDDPFDVALQVTPVARVDAVVSKLQGSGFAAGPAPSHVICLHEGDVIELGFSGNVECTEHLPARLIYKSNVPTVTYFRVKEENQYRQKDHTVFSGLLVLSRRFVDKSFKGRREEGTEEEVRTKIERLCALQINIPKHHIEPSQEPRKAQLPIKANGPIDLAFLRQLASSLGDEWRLVAHYLGVHRARVQAILRNVAVGERSENEAKYDMLMTWMKRATRALDKVSVLAIALRNSDRPDLADRVLSAGGRGSDTRRSSASLVH